MGTGEEAQGLIIHLRQPLQPLLCLVSSTSPPNKEVGGVEELSLTINMQRESHMKVMAGSAVSNVWRKVAGKRFGGSLTVSGGMC